MNTSSPAVYREDDYIVMPGLATAHSHAFQRALRGRTQWKSSPTESFWSWRGLMYELAKRLSPDDVFNLSRFAFVELALSGVTAVGEFHYLHHQQDGTPYHDRLELADAVINAASEVGVRITLLRTAYFRAGTGQALTQAQRRFCDRDVDDVLKDIEGLAKRYRDNPLVKIGVAAHSIRAVEREQLRALAEFARGKAMPFHMHISEQQREVEECNAEYGLPPVALLAEDGLLHDQFVGIHATHLSADEISALGAARAFVCLCRTTERDLGDGLPQTADLLQAGVRLCVGVDSHASPDAFEEIRAVELDERSRSQQRIVAAEATQLLEMATRNGTAAIGFDDAWQKSKIYLKDRDPALACSSDATLADAVIFGATPRAVDHVVVEGKTIVAEGRHKQYEEAYRGYRRSLTRLGLLQQEGLI